MVTKQQNQFSPIAIVGLGAMFPGRGTNVGYWQDILEARDATSDVPESHWRLSDYFDADPTTPDKTYSCRGAFIPSFAFDPIEFGTPPAVIETTDTVQLIALYVAKRVLAEATRTSFREIDTERTSVILGVAAGTEMIGDMASRLNRPVWLKAMSEAGIDDDNANRIADKIAGSYTEWRESTFPGLLGNVVAGRIANRLNLNGTNFTADAACASSLAAIKYAMQELWLGESDLVLTGGADALNNIFMYMCFSKTPAMSPSGQCRPFARDADGTVLGEGCGILALRRLEDAERDGNCIYGLIRGIGTSSDGSATAVYAPRSGGQALALKRAYDMAGYSPRTVGLVEGHGTGTRAGDAAEFAGLTEVFGADASGAEAWCALGSVKSQIGHTKSAAGAAGLIKVLLALHHKVLPPTINVGQPNPKLGIDGSPFYLNTAARPWTKTPDDPPRRASISSFGFGGSNFHITLEEYAGPAARPPKYRTSPVELFLFSASSADGLRAAVEGRLSAIADDADLAHHAKETGGTFRSSDNLRLSIVASSREDLRAKAAKALPLIAQNKPFTVPDIAFAIDEAANGKIGFLFAGQGSQYLNMGADLAMTFDCAREAWETADATTPEGCERLSRIVFAPPAFDDETRSAQQKRLTATENAQPAIAAVALSQMSVLDRIGIRPSVVAGHSFGEIMALHAAGVFGADTAVAIARDRGVAMAGASAGVEAGMLAVMAGKDAVAPALAAVGGGEVVIANDNSPGQVILSGTKAGLDAVAKRLAAMNLQTKPLPVATAFHSPVVAAAAKVMSAALTDRAMTAPSIPVYANITAAPYPRDVAGIKASLSDQIAQPVRFREMIEAMYADGVRVFVEVGPKSVLTNLVGQILPGKPHVAVALDEATDHGMQALLRAVGRIAVAGVPVNLDFLFEEAPAPAPLPAAKKHAIHLNGANYRKPFPPKTASPAAEAETSQGANAGAPGIASTTAEAQPASRPVAAPPPVPKMVATAATAPASVNVELAVVETPIAMQPALGAAPAAAPTAPAPGVGDVGEVVRAVVAEKTGYPPEMLELDMDLEGELGIDSIKQVEILSALRERLPAMPDIEPARLAELRTLNQIATAIGGSAAAMPAPVTADQAPVTVAETPAAAAAPAAAPNEPGPSLLQAEETIGVYRQRVELKEKPATAEMSTWFRKGRRIGVTNCEPAVADALVSKFVERGLDASVVDPQTVPAVDSLVVTSGLSTELTNAQVHLAALRAARQVAARFAQSGGAFVTLQDTGGQFGRTLDDAYLASTGGLTGLVKTARHEWPSAMCKAVDIEQNRDSDGNILHTTIRRIVEEILFAGDDVEVGLPCDGRRLVPACNLEAARNGAPRADVLEEDAVVIVSGGGRGITARAVIEVAKNTRLRFALFGRSNLVATPADIAPAASEGEIRGALARAALAEGRKATPKEIAEEAAAILAAREIQATLAAIRETGSEVEYYPLDITDVGAVMHRCSAIRRKWGPISGIIHGAGLLADKLIKDKTDEQFEKVFAVKVAGLHALLAGCGHGRLKLVALFSSFAGRFGNPGQADYAMANEALNRSAWAIRNIHPDCHVVAINWGPWAGGMVDDGIRAQFEARGVAIIPEDVGAAAFVRETLVTPDGHPEVVFASIPEGLPVMQAGAA